MSKPVYTVLFCLLTFSWAVGQKVEVKVNKDTDFSRFRTFYMMPGEVVLVLNKEVSREALKEGVRKGVIANLEDKGYQQTTDSTSADLAITFVAEVVERLEQQNLGPFGQTPMRTPVDMRSDTWTQEIRSGSLVIEVVERSTGKTLWSSSTTITFRSFDITEGLQAAVARSLRKFPKTKK